MFCLAHTVSVHIHPNWHLMPIRYSHPSTLSVTWWIGVLVNGNAARVFDITLGIHFTIWGGCFASNKFSSTTLSPTSKGSIALYICSCSIWVFDLINLSENPLNACHVVFYFSQRFTGLAGSWIRSSARLFASLNHVAKWALWSRRLSPKIPNTWRRRTVHERRRTKKRHFPFFTENGTSYLFRAVINWQERERSAQRKM